MGMNMIGMVKKGKCWEPAETKNFVGIERFIDEEFGIRFCTPLRKIFVEAGDKFDFRLHDDDLFLDKDLQMELSNIVENKYNSLPVGNEKRWCNLLLKFLKICINNGYMVSVN